MKQYLLFLGTFLVLLAITEWRIRAIASEQIRILFTEVSNKKGAFVRAGGEDRLGEIEAELQQCLEGAEGCEDDR